MVVKNKVWGEKTSYMVSLLREIKNYLTGLPPYFYQKIGRKRWGQWAGILLIIYRLVNILQKFE